MTATILATVQEAPDRWVVFASNELVYIISRDAHGRYAWTSWSDVWQWSVQSYASRQSCEKHLARYLARWTQDAYGWVAPR